MTNASAAQVNIPIIDISGQNKNAAAELLDAASKYGFVFIENDTAGIPPHDIAHMFDVSREFFAAPTEIKQEVAISSNKAGKNHGWLSRGVEKLDPATQKRPDVKEAMNIGEHIDGELQQPMPRPLQSHTQEIMDFQDSCFEFCQRIFERFSEALGIDHNWFTSRHGKGSSSIFRFLWYPYVDDAENGVDIRAGAHSDYGSITLLFQLPGQPGLEIKTPSGEWAPVPVDPREGSKSAANGDSPDDSALPILVNFGDLLDDWTGGLLKSTVHRVIFPKGGSSEDRYSIAYFCHPVDDAELVPVPSKLVQEHATKTGKCSTRSGKVLTAKDHLMERLAATYTVK